MLKLSFCLRCEYPYLWDYWSKNFYGTIVFVHPIVPSKQGELTDFHWQRHWNKNSYYTLVFLSIQIPWKQGRFFAKEFKHKKAFCQMHTWQIQMDCIFNCVFSFHNHILANKYSWLCDTLLAYCEWSWKCRAKKHLGREHVQVRYDWLLNVGRKLKNTIILAINYCLTT